MCKRLRVKTVKERHCVTVVGKAGKVVPNEVDMSSPTVGPARVVWARKVAAAEERLHVKARKEKLHVTVGDES